MTIELLVNVLARAALGLFTAFVFVFFIWRFSEASVDLRSLSIGWFFLTQAVMLGVAATIPTTFAWWNTQSSNRIRLLYFTLILGTAMACAWLVNEIRGVETHYALFGGVRRVPVFSLTHMFVSMIFGAVLGANALAAGLYIFRALRRREF